MDIYDIFIVNLKIARKAKGLSQLELSRKAGLCDNYVNQIENGRKSVNIDSVGKLAKALDTPVYLLFYDKYPNIPEIESKRPEIEFLQYLVEIANNYLAIHK